MCVGDTETRCLKRVWVGDTGLCVCVGDTETRARAKGSGSSAANKLWKRLLQTKA